jgi:hypothetical protein
MCGPSGADRPDRAGQSYSGKATDSASVDARRARPICFPSHQSRREYRRTCETAGKSGIQIERCVIPTFQIAASMGFKGEFRQWEDLLRVGDLSGLHSRSVVQETGNDDAPTRGQLIHYHCVWNFKLKKMWWRKGGAREFRPDRTVRVPFVKGVRNTAAVMKRVPPPSGSGSGADYPNDVTRVLCD